MKENRPLIIVPRETPLATVHLETWPSCPVGASWSYRPCPDSTPTPLHRGHGRLHRRRILINSTSSTALDSDGPATRSDRHNRRPATHGTTALMKPRGTTSMDEDLAVLNVAQLKERLREQGCPFPAGSRNWSTGCSAAPAPPHGRSRTSTLTRPRSTQARCWTPCPLRSEACKPSFDARGQWASPWRVSSPLASPPCC